MEKERLNNTSNTHLVGECTDSASKLGETLEYDLLAVVRNSFRKENEVTHEYKESEEPADISPFSSFDFQSIIKRKLQSVSAIEVSKGKGLRNTSYIGSSSSFDLLAVIRKQLKEEELQSSVDILVVENDEVSEVKQTEYIYISSFNLLEAIRRQLQQQAPSEISIPEDTKPIPVIPTEKAPRKKKYLAIFLPIAAVIAIGIATWIWYIQRPVSVMHMEDIPPIEEIVIEPDITVEELPPPIPNEIISITIPRQETYLPFGGTQQFETILDFTGEIDETIIWRSSDDEVATVDEEGLVTGHSNGIVTITATAENGMSDSSEVVVTDCIILPSYEYKAFIPAYYYSDEQAAMMDRILASRIEDAGGPGTRGAVVAAARFITLEMPYMIPYFYENGRMVPHPGRPTCDGEGRYYHVGLYLSVDKYETIERSVAGPAIWGAPLTNYMDAGYFTRGLKYPNGLDCSGFVSWAMVNGGIDTGDIGAGDYYGIEREFSKIGEKLPLSIELLLSGEIKPGDLIGIDGHIAIICGLTDTHIWISESYYRGVNTVCFTINRGIIDCQEYDFIIKMDHMYYAGEGIYTDTWVTE